MPPIVVDTNVFATADGLNDAASPECVDACLQIVLQVERGTKLLVDDGGEILSEYLGTLNARKAAGVAAKLVLRLYHLRFGGSCETTAITPVAAPPPSYVEVPAALADFDADDQKFIAVAATTNGASPIVAGVDGEWWDRRTDFATSGLLVQFPCLADLLRR